MKQGFNKLNIFQQHQYKIAEQTLKMPKAMVGVMGGMTKAEARLIKKRLDNMNGFINGNYRYL